MLRPLILAVALTIPAAAMAADSPMWQKSTPGAAPAQNHGTMPMNHPAMPQGNAAQPGAAANTGKVLKTRDAAGYTYVQVDAAGKNLWLAGPTIDLKAGDTIKWGQGVMMSNFHSKSLNETFPQILFVDSISK